jgi:protein SCO1/2
MLDVGCSSSRFQCIPDLWHWRLPLFRVFLVLMPLLSLPLAGCRRAADASLTSASPNPDTNAQLFQVKGVVLEVKPREKSVTIRHEAVAGYMPAMTMPFDVKDAAELTGLEAGDPVSFRLLVTDTEGWIDGIRKTGPRTNTPPTTGPFRLVRDVEPLNTGDPLPEYHFTNQFGQAFSTARFKGQALAIQFLFTRCPFPTFCPLMANRFEAAQNTLLAMTNGPANWQLLTLSFDPQFDTPAVLKTYAENHHYNAAHWTFATGELIDITAIGDQFGLAFWHDETGGISHNLRTVVIDASGRLRRVFAGNEWTPAELAAEMVAAAGPGPTGNARN